MAFIMKLFFYFLSRFIKLAEPCFLFTRNLRPINYSRALFSILFVLSLFFSYSFTISSDSKNKDRIEFLKQQIKQTEEILAHLNKDKSNFITQLNIRQGLIKHRNELITGINTELEELSQELLNLELGNKLGLEKLEEYKKDYQRVARQKKHPSLFFSRIPNI